jgi:hypothetical protein
MVGDRVLYIVAIVPAGPGLRAATPRALRTYMSHHGVHITAGLGRIWVARALL